jgi:hypothetical protein
MSDAPALIEYGKFIRDAVLATSTVWLGVLGFRRNVKVKALKEEKEEA